MPKHALVTPPTPRFAPIDEPDLYTSHKPDTGKRQGALLKEDTKKRLRAVIPLTPDETPVRKKRMMDHQEFDKKNANARALFQENDRKLVSSRYDDGIRNTTLVSRSHLDNLKEADTSHRPRIMVSPRKHTLNTSSFTRSSLFSTRPGSSDSTSSSSSSSSTSSRRPGSSSFATTEGTMSPPSYRRNPHSIFASRSAAANQDNREHKLSFSFSRPTIASTAHSESSSTVRRHINSTIALSRKHHTNTTEHAPLSSSSSSSSLTTPSFRNKPAFSSSNQISKSPISSTSNSRTHLPQTPKTSSLITRTFKETSKLQVFHESRPPRPQRPHNTIIDEVDVQGSYSQIPHPFADDPQTKDVPGMWHNFRGKKIFRPFANGENPFKDYKPVVLFGAKKNSKSLAESSAPIVRRSEGERRDESTPINPFWKQRGVRPSTPEIESEEDTDREDDPPRRFEKFRMSRKG